MATKGLYLQRGLKREKKSHRKLILLLAVLLVLGVLLAPLLWKKSRSRTLQESSSTVTAPVKTDKAGLTVVTGKIPKTAPVAALQDSTPSQGSQPTGGAVSSEKTSPSQQPPKETPVESTSPGTDLAAKSSPELASPSSGTMEKQQNVYELRADLKQKELAEDKKAKEMVAQSALKEMPFPSSSAEKTGTAGTQPAPAGKHTVVSMLKPEKEPKEVTQKKSSPPEKPSAKLQTTPKGKQTIPAPQQESSITPATSKPAEANVLETTRSVNNQGTMSYWIQVGAYREEANAKKVKAIVDGLGYEAVIKEGSHPKLGKIYIVRVPVKGSRSEVQKIMSTISQRTGDKPILMESR